MFRTWGRGPAIQTSHEDLSRTQTFACKAASCTSGDALMLGNPHAVGKHLKVSRTLLFLEIVAPPIVRLLSGLNIPRNQPR